MSFPFANYREEVRARVSVEDILSSHGFEIGADRKTRCPKHNDQGTPNAHVYDDHVFCFRCQWHADVFGLVEHLDGVTHAEAVRMLARSAGMPALNSTPEDLIRLKREACANDALTEAAKYYGARLSEKDRAYLLGRGVTPEQIESVGFGSSDGGLTNALIKKGFTAEELCTPSGAEKPGEQWLATTKRRDAELADFLWPGLLVIPIKARGRVVGMVARRMDDGLPKYLNLPGTRSAFGFDSLSAGDDVILVEGVFDALALHRHGLSSIALMGVAMNEAFGIRLKRAELVYIMMDGDGAGSDGALKVARQLGGRARIITLAAGKDPDQLTKEEVVEAVTASRDLVGHLISLLDKSLREMKLVERIEELGLIGALAAEDETRREAHLDEMRGHLGLNKTDFTAMRSALKKRVVKAADELDKSDVKRTEPVQWLVLKDGRMLDVVLDRDRRSTILAVYDPRTDSVELCKTVDLGEFAVEALSDAEVVGTRGADLFHPEAGRSVLLHEGPLEYGTEAQLFADVQAFIHRYFEEPDPNWRDLAAAYVMFSWVVEFASDCPYLSWTGGPGSGKTRAMQVVGWLCRRPMILSVGSSPAALRRTVDRWRGTLIADEGLTNDKSDAGLAVMQMILSGFSRPTAVVQICDGENNEPRSYYIFGPKLFTGQVDFRDEGARSRTLTRTLSADRRRKDQPVDLPPAFEAEAETIRRKLQMWRFRTLAAESKRRNTGGDGPDRSASFAEALRGVPSRVQQVFLPMLRAVTDESVQKRLIEVAKAHTKSFVDAKSERPEGLALRAAAELMAESGGRMPRQGTAGRIYLKAIRDRLVTFAQADGVDDRTAKQFVPSPAKIGQKFRGTLDIDTKKDAKGAYLVLETETHLLTFESAMANFGIEIPWPVPTAPDEASPKDTTSAPPPTEKPNATEPPPSSGRAPRKPRLRDLDDDRDYDVPPRDADAEAMFTQVPEDRD